MRRSLMLNSIEIASTPLLVPSFSSKGFPDVKEILSTCEQLIEGEILVSAYDIHYGSLAPPFSFASLVFLDSGGYEASKDVELSDLGEFEHVPRAWHQDLYLNVVSSLPWDIPTVAISYDHPRERLTVAEQIERAARLMPRSSGVLREILLKPEKSGEEFLRIDSVISQLKGLAEFDVIGITEKEIGNSIFLRMKNIASLRLALRAAGLETPIHVFGSLDTISSPLYFVAGADIFDGLTWLRFAYRDGYTIYKHNYGAVDLGVQTEVDIIDGRCWFNNYYYLRELQRQMRQFLSGHDFNSFKHHSELMRTAFESVADAAR